MTSNKSQIKLWFLQQEYFAPLFKKKKPELSSLGCKQWRNNLQKGPLLKSNYSVAFQRPYLPISQLIWISVIQTQS